LQSGIINQNAQKILKNLRKGVGVRSRLTSQVFLPSGGVAIITTLLLQFKEMLRFFSKFPLKTALLSNLFENFSTFLSQKEYSPTSD